MSAEGKRFNRFLVESICYGRWSELILAGPGRFAEVREEVLGPLAVLLGCFEVDSLYRTLLEAGAVPSPV